MYCDVLVISLTLLFSFLSTIAMRYDFSRAGFHYYDIIQSSPYSILATFIWSTFISFYLFRMKSSTCRNSRFHIVFLSMLAPLPFLIEVVANYPSIWARDVYLHGQIKFLDSVGTLDKLEYSYPKQYPNFFLIWYIVYKVSGITDIREANLIILYPALFLSFLLFLYASYKHMFTKTTRNNVDTSYTAIGVLLASSLVMFNRSELTFQHANTRIYAIDILFFSILLLLLCRRVERKFTIIFLYMISTINLVMSHVLFPLVVATVPFILIALDIFSNEKRLLIKKYTITFIPLISWLLWNLWNYTTSTTVKTGITSFFNYLYQELGRELVISSLSIREPIPLVGVYLRISFKTIIIVFTLISLIYISYEFRLIRKKPEKTEFYDMKIWTSYILATILVFGVTAFSASLGNSIDRMMITYIPLIVPLTLKALGETKGFVYKKLPNGLRITISALILIFTVCVIPSQFILLHEISVADANTAPLDVTCAFLNNHLTKDPGLITASPFMIYYVYFDPDATVYRYSGDLGLIGDISQLSDIYLLNHGVKVIDYRSIIQWSYRYESYQQGFNEWLSAILEPLYVSNSIIYQNGEYEWIFYG